MDNQNEPSAKIPAIRTYASDLEANRKSKGLSPEEGSVKGDEKLKAPTVVVEKIIEPKRAEILRGTSEIKEVEPIQVDTPIAVPEEITIKAEMKPMSSKNSTFIVENEDSAAATIITDTKKDRFKLIPSIIESLKNWFEAKKLERQKKKIPKYTVPETTRRKGVIQKATSMTGKLATSDFDSIQDRIRNRQNKEDGPTTTWTANTEPGFLLLEEPEPIPVTNVQLVNRKSFRSPAPEITITPEKILTPKIAPIINEKIIEEEVIEPEPIIPEIEITTEPASIVDIELEPEHDVTIETVVPVKTKSRRRFDFLSMNTNLLSLSVSGLILALIIVVTYGHFIVSTQEIITPSYNNKVEPIIDSELKLVFGDFDTETSLVNTLNSEKSNQFVFTYSNSNQEIIPTNILLKIFNISLEQNFAQAISQIYFGKNDLGAPYILMKTTNLTAVKGGMLAWEKTMYQDLTSILQLKSLPVENNNRFIDASLSGVDVRVIKNDSSNDQLIYGILDNVVIITSNSSNFSGLLKRIK